MEFLTILHYHPLSRQSAQLMSCRKASVVDFYEQICSACPAGKVPGLCSFVWNIWTTKLSQSVHQQWNSVRKITFLVLIINNSEPTRCAKAFGLIFWDVWKRKNCNGLHKLSHFEQVSLFVKLCMWYVINLSKLQLSSLRS